MSGRSKQPSSFHTRLLSLSLVLSCLVLSCLVLSCLVLSSLLSTCLWYSSHSQSASAHPSSGPKSLGRQGTSTTAGGTHRPANQASISAAVAVAVQVEVSRFRWLRMLPISIGSGHLTSIRLSFPGFSCSLTHGGDKSTSSQSGGCDDLMTSMNAYSGSVTFY